MIFLAFSLFLFLSSVFVQANNALALQSAALSSRAVGPVENDAAISPIILRHFARS